MPDLPSIQDDPLAAPVSATLLSTPVPGTLNVIKRTGTMVPYDEQKIVIAITKAFLEVEGGQAVASPRIRDLSHRRSAEITEVFRKRLPSGGSVHIEEIQDQVELALMRHEHHKAARSYVLYRESHAAARAERAGAVARKIPQVKRADGSVEPLDMAWLDGMAEEACRGVADVSPGQLAERTLRDTYTGMPVEDIPPLLTIAARAMIETEPGYTYVAARLLLNQLRSEALGFLGIAESATADEMRALYPQALACAVEQGVAHERFTAELRAFDLARLGEALDAERDMQFSYQGMQILYDRYFTHVDGVRIELPQVFFMRVAMGLALRESRREERAIEFYHLLSSFDYMCSTPTLFNSASRHSQLSSCYLTTVPDNLNGIFSAIHDNAMLSKWAGGLGNDWTPVRALGSHIKDTNGKSQGVVPFLKVVNDTAVAVNQGGKRRGAVCSYLETWHLDIEEFLELRKNTGDDRRRTHDMNTANWVPDLFMQRVFEGGDWTLFSPSDVPDLHDLYGAAFKDRYEAYEAVAERGEIRHRRMPALDLWRRMLEMLYECGHPWITFKDSCNLRSPQQHVGVVHSSNLCTEITLNTNEDEIAVCNLGSINIANHLDDSGDIDQDRLRRTVRTATRMLDNVIDLNYYAVQKARQSNMRHRPVGLGLMGFQDALYRQRMPYGSEEAVAFADRSMELISYFAIEASSELAVERGVYSSFEGSLWSQGVLPIDSIERLARERAAGQLDVDDGRTLDWDALRDTVRRQGMRNSNVLAIAPTATIANIIGVSQSIEPTYQNLYAKSNLSGEFTVVNQYLVHELKDLGLWDAVMVNDLKYYDGSVQRIERIPDWLKTLYATAFELEPRWIVDAASRRQKWIDQAQSLNIYVATGTTGRQLDMIYRMAWVRGLKTTYYLRSLAATRSEPSTAEAGQANAVPASAPALAAGANGSDQSEASPAVACAIEDPDCEACQ